MFLTKDQAVDMACNVDANIKSESDTHNIDIGCNLSTDNFKKLTTLNKNKLKIN